MRYAVLRCTVYCCAVVCCAAGLLIGLGESRRERLADLLTIQQLQQQYGHIQEVIIQNFR
jgi:FO synthase